MSEARRPKAWIAALSESSKAELLEWLARTDHELDQANEALADAIRRLEQNAPHAVAGLLVNFPEACNRVKR